MILEFSGVKKRFGKKEILSNVTFNIEKGEIIGLIGRSGCGKTTLLKLLMGIIEPNGGGIYLDGLNTFTKTEYLKKRTGFSTQEDTLIQDLSIIENAIYFGKLYGIRRKEIKKRFEDLSEMLGLYGLRNIQIKNLSGGMKKRANFLVALIHNPSLLILDEPTTGLDSLLRENIWSYIRNINESGTTIIVTSHRLEEIEANCSRIAVLDEGIILEFDTLENLKEKYGSELDLNKIFEKVLR